MISFLINWIHIKSILLSCQIFSPGELLLSVDQFTVLNEYLGGLLLLPFPNLRIGHELYGLSKTEFGTNRIPATQVAF